MQRSRVLAWTIVFCMAGSAGAASDPLQHPDTKAPSQVDFALPPLPPQPPLAADLSPPGFLVEFGDRLRASAKLTAADKADRAALASFYEGRRHEPLWVSDNGLTPAAQSAIAEIRDADAWGLDRSAFKLPAVAAGFVLTREARADAEIEMSLAVLKYARHARGGRANPLAISKNLDRPIRLLDPRVVIEAAARSDDPAAYLRSLHPQHPQFERLRQRYVALKRQQQLGGSAEASPGKSSATTLRMLLANMEQWRWMPDDLGSFHVWVNIPEFTLRVVADGKMVHTERVVVGKVATPTPVFSDAMTQVIFHPFWGVPDSIKQKELLPSLARGNTGVLERSNLRIQYRGRDINPASVDWSRADMRKFHVYQPPGAGNVLGVVKFRFPNKHDVYIHDTSSKGLFSASVRTFSHGCMRLRDPLKLAELVLARDRSWTAQRVSAVVRSGPKNNQINLSHSVPIHITYFTAWVDDDGTLRVFGDVYGLEGRIAASITGKAPQAGETPPVRARVARPVPRGKVRRARTS